MVESSVESQRSRANQVDARKRTIESRLAEILAELDSMPGSPGLYASLVDSEGYPRSDVDIMRTRQLRQEHIMLHNDLRTAVDELHKLLNDIHDAARNSGTTAAPAVPSAVKTEGSSIVPFALVQAVERGSPADAGNLQVGDKVIRFGDAQGAAGLTTLQTRLQKGPKFYDTTWYMSWDGAMLSGPDVEQSLPTTVNGPQWLWSQHALHRYPRFGVSLQEYKDTAQDVLVQRRGDTVQLQITPQSWSGRGLLGGTLVPL